MHVFQRWQERRRLRQTAERLAAARRAGHGLYLREWCDEQQDASLIEVILSWCRETLGGCRRPWGIDQFDLTLACTTPSGEPVRRLSLRRLRITDLYHGDRLAGDLRTLLFGDREQGESDDRRGVVLHVAAALFSWGDAAHAALPAVG